MATEPERPEALQEAADWLAETIASSIDMDWSPHVAAKLIMQRIKDGEGDELRAVLRAPDAELVEAHKLMDAYKRGHADALKTAAARLQDRDDEITWLRAALTRAKGNA